MARPRSLTPARIAAAALAVIDHDGLAALSMRTVARELGMGTMSLYRYVEDREQLERLVVDAILEGVDFTLPAEASWTERVTVLVERMRDAVGMHAAVVPLLVAHRHESKGIFRWGEAVLGALTEAGMTGERRAITFRCLLSYVIGALQYQQLGPLSGPGTAALASLPHDEYPLLTETARHGRGIAPDDELRCGLAVLFRGIQACDPRIDAIAEAGHGRRRERGIVARPEDQNAMHDMNRLTEQEVTP
jgi:AcrR family transcriptional regulator